MEPERARSQDGPERETGRAQRTRRHHSAGGVAYRWHARERHFEIALIATRGGTRWQLPKGAREGDESALQTAIREVEEEVGLRTEHEDFLKTIEFWYWDTHGKQPPELVHKSVDFFLLRVVGGLLSDASYEVDGVGWFTFEEAQSILTFQGELEVVELAQARLQENRATPPA